MTKLVVPPSTPAVTLAEAKANMRVTATAEDDLITEAIRSATDYLDGIDGILGKALMPQTYELVLDRFPSGAIKLPVGPVVSVTGVWRTDENGDEEQVDAEEYEVDPGTLDGWVVPTGDWPTTMETINSVRVRWVAGTGCPASIKEAILLLVAQWYENRGAVGPSDIKELPFSVTALTSTKRRWFV